MSSDDTRNDDPTTKLPNESKYDTKPGITAVLERINQLGDQFNRRFDELQSEVSGMRADLRRVEQKVDLLAKDMFELRTDHQLLVTRVGDLERKAS